MQVQFEAVCRPKFMPFCSDIGYPLQLSTNLPDYVYLVLFRRYRQLNLPLSCEVGEKGVLGPDLQGRVCPRFRTCIFKSHLLSSMWPVLVEFRSASWEGSGRLRTYSSPPDSCCSWYLSFNSLELIFRFISPFAGGKLYHPLTPTLILLTLIITWVN